MNTKTETILFVVAAVVVFVLAVKFIGLLFGFVVDHPVFVIVIAVAASVGAAVYFASGRAASR